MAPRILIVEDETIIASDISEILTEAGYDVIGVTPTAGDAEDVLNNGGADFILLDINLAERHDGIELAGNWSEKLPILFLTALSDEQTLKKARETGAEGYLLKPADQQDLLLMIESIWEGTEDETLTVNRGEFFC